MKAALPNVITSGRFVLALIFFVLMENYRHGTYPGGPPGSPLWVLDLAFALFVITAVTDILDGYLARRWKQESAFGRILDPLVDKVLIVGAFIYLASSHFACYGPGFCPGDAQPTARIAYNASGVAPWMVVLILIRELLVTGLRGFSEAQGLSFKATIPGKVKMFVQCFAAGTVMVVTGHAEQLFPGQHWPYLLRDGTLWLMVVVTVFSMLVYMERARGLLLLGLRGREKKV